MEVASRQADPVTSKPASATKAVAALHELDAQLASHGYAHPSVSTLATTRGLVHHIIALLVIPDPQHHEPLDEHRIRMAVPLFDSFDPKEQADDAPVVLWSCLKHASERILRLARLAHSKGATLDEIVAAAKGDDDGRS